MFENVQEMKTQKQPVSSVVLPFVRKVPPVQEKRNSWLEALIGFLWRAALVLGEGPRLVRHVGPGLPPLERHEFENPSYRSHHQFGGGPY